MAPMILLGTVATHLFGGSAGREGTALQMGASLADALRRALRLDRHDRRLMLMAGISGGFGSVFGTPAAGFVFGMEVQALGRIRYEGLVPCLVAACVGDLVARALGVPHTHYPALPVTGIDALLLAKVAAAGLACGLAAFAFIELTHAVKRWSGRIPQPWLRPAVGGVVVLALTGALGTHDFLGLSLPLATRSVHGEDVVLWAFAAKLVFTVITLGSGFLGGEVTPLFVIGAALGHALGRLLGVDPAFMAMLGFVAVFAGASNTPLACVLMGVELFGGGALVYSLTICAVAYLASGHRSIYRTQRLDTPKSPAPTGSSVDAASSAATIMNAYIKSTKKNE
jgi:H+/Cl- antiporter ClcA